MPRYRITNNQTGESLLVEANTPPTGADVDYIFSQQKPKNEFEGNPFYEKFTHPTPFNPADIGQLNGTFSDVIKPEFTDAMTPQARTATTKADNLLAESEKYKSMASELAGRTDPESVQRRNYLSGLSNGLEQERRRILKESGVSVVLSPEETFSRNAEMAIQKSIPSPEEMKTLGVPGWTSPILKGLYRGGAGFIAPENVMYLAATPKIPGFAPAFTADVASKTAAGVGEAVGKISSGETNAGLEQLAENVPGEVFTGIAAKRWFANGARDSVVNELKTAQDKLLQVPFEIEQAAISGGSPKVAPAVAGAKEGSIQTPLNESTSVPFESKTRPMEEIKVPLPKANAETIYDIAKDFVERIGQLDKTTETQRQKSALIRAILKSPNEYQAENLGRILGLKFDPVATGIPEQYRFVKFNTYEKGLPTNEMWPEQKQAQGGEFEIFKRPASSQTLPEGNYGLATQIPKELLERTDYATKERPITQGSQPEHTGTASGENVSAYNEQVRKGTGEQTINSNRLNGGGIEPTKTETLISQEAKPVPQPTEPATKSAPPEGAEPVTTPAPAGPAKSNVSTLLEKVKQTEPVATESVLSDNLKMRKLSERGTTGESIPTEVQEQIKKSPESFYYQQKMSDVESSVKRLNDADLAIVPKDSPIKTAAVLEQATRLFNSGKNQEGYQVFQDWSAELTRMGQVINQAKLLNALRPENVVTVVNESLKKAGKDPLNLDQQVRLEILSRNRIETQLKLDKATEEWMKNPTDENAKLAEQSLIDANKSALAEQQMVHKFQNRSMAALTKAILQGNLLTPISLVANVVGNVNFIPFRIATRAGATVLDLIDSSLRNRKREVSVSPISGTGETVYGLIKGAKEIPSILKYGSGDVIKGESRASLHPMRAWINLFSKNPDVPTVEGKISTADRIKMAIEGTFGISAESMLRGLGAGDIASREAARSRLISEQSRLNNVPENQRKMAQLFPELFFDSKTLARIESETRGAIFQRESQTLSHIMSWMKGKGDFFDLLVSTVAPYKLTPWNIVGEILSYNPLIAAGRTMLEAKRGNIRSAEMNASKMVVGSMLITAGAWLYNKGLLAPSMDSSDEKQKARVLAGEILPPNHINISGLKRALSGGDPSFKPGDETRDIFRAGGLAGSMFYMAANVGRDMETKPEADVAIMSLLKNSTLEQARFGINQSFLKGVTGLLDAVRTGEADNYIQAYANTILSVPLPNTLSAISRAEREYKVEMKSDSVIKQIENVVKTKLGFMGLDDYMPLKRGLWGEPLLETPKNRSALIYHFFDITKGKQVTDDPVPLELYRLWRKTSNTSVIPSPPDNTFTFGKKTYLLTPEQRSKYAELVGLNRRSIVNRLVINPEWQKLNDESKIKILNRAYDKGAEIGKARFWLDYGQGLSLKQKPIGFNIQ